MRLKGYRHPQDILQTVRWYLRYSLSYRDLEEMLKERGVCVDLTSIFQWVHRCTPELLAAFMKRKASVGGGWRVDETYVKVTGQRRYVDKSGVDRWVEPR